MAVTLKQSMYVTIPILRSQRRRLLQFLDGSQLGSGENLEIKPPWTMGKVSRRSQCADALNSNMKKVLDPYQTDSGTLDFKNKTLMLSPWFGCSRRYEWYLKDIGWTCSASEYRSTIEDSKLRDMLLADSPHRRSSVTAKDESLSEVPSVMSRPRAA
jgi:hypothetical protein